MVTLHSDTLSVHILNVGDGDSIIVELPEEQGKRYHIVVDSYDGGKTEDYLRLLNADRLKLVVATHPHLDHIAGLKGVLEAFQNVEQFWDSGFRHTSKTWDDLINYLNTRKEIFFLRPTSGLFTAMAGVELTVLAPSIYLRNRYDTLGVNINNASIVLKLTYADHSMILAADAQWDSWTKMTEEFPHIEKTSDPLQRIKAKENFLPLKSDAIKVAHHGSKHGTALEALERLEPKYAAISCAKNSKHDFPHELATGALKELKTKIFNTKDGSIIFTFEANGTVNAEQYKDETNENPPPPNRV